MIAVSFIFCLSYSIRDFYHVKSRYLFVYLCIFRVLHNYIVRQLYFKLGFISLFIL